MLSIPDLAIVGALALIFFGPDQLPRVARRAGQMVREVQMTSQSFVREMERAADEADERDRLRDLEKYQAEAPLESALEPSSHDPAPLAAEGHPGPPAPARHPGAEDLGF